MCSGDITVTCGRRCALIQHRLIDDSLLGQVKADRGQPDRQGGSGGGSPRSPPAHRLSSAPLVLTCFPAAKMTDFAGRTRFQQPKSKALGTASVLTGEVGFFAVKVQNETQPPVRLHSGSCLPGRYALLLAFKRTKLLYHL